MSPRRRTLHYSILFLLNISGSPPLETNYLNAATLSHLTPSGFPLNYITHFFRFDEKKNVHVSVTQVLKKKTTQKTFMLLFFVHKTKNFHSFPISVHILVLCAACTTGHLVSKSRSCLSDAPVFLNLILYSLNQFPSHLHSLFVDGTTLPPPGRHTNVSFFHYQFNFLFFNPS